MIPGRLEDKAFTNMPAIVNDVNLAVFQLVPWKLEDKAFFWTLTRMCLYCFQEGWRTRHSRSRYFESEADSYNTGATAVRSVCRRSCYASASRTAQQSNHYDFLDRRRARNDKPANSRQVKGIFPTLGLRLCDYSDHRLVLIWLSPLEEKFWKTYWGNYPRKWNFAGEVRLFLRKFMNGKWHAFAVVAFV